MAEALGSVLPEPLEAGKNPMTPFSVVETKGGPTSCVTACRRIIADCLVEAIVAMGKLSPQQLLAMRRSGSLAKMRKSNHKSCLKICSKPTSRNYARLQAMKKCATKRTCTAVGACTALHVK
jgi:hypothetical protein